MRWFVRFVCWSILKRLQGEPVVQNGRLGIPIRYGVPKRVVPERLPDGRTRFDVVVESPDGAAFRVDFQTLSWNRSAGQWESPAARPE